MLCFDWLLGCQVLTWSCNLHEELLEGSIPAEEKSDDKTPAIAECNEIAAALEILMKTFREANSTMWRDVSVRPLGVQVNLVLDLPLLLLGSTADDGANSSPDARQWTEERQGMEVDLGRVVVACPAQTDEYGKDIPAKRQPIRIFKVEYAGLSWRVS